ncbi:uncharacterized protein K489DRAFT_43660 [Dissoconium aciculare CBS 342.82]|uniref:Transcription factor TFIIIC triple barrel domain-containing protein n=1 Tax=Dissoconium aciculare CBS 342.82 TaxID=1314786 RepID=A0A6J3LYH9_9PEZI|nr:uncharacterized protein K489DRAFT_43660 [Dissoconium aciculare CBS 342.82]KAF1820816.1 hypothetical protein K489DRAFT_43660 [Dissoconium aciculare CBS 342.82]
MVIQAESMATDEWEYEYDPNETEDCYITLDLTTYVPDALATKSNTRTAKQPTSIDNDKTPQSENDAAPTSVGKLEIADLHTRQPFIKFNDRMYHGTWSTDYGSQVYVANPGAVQDPVLAGNMLDIVGVSRARIVATPARLRGEQKSATQHDVLEDENLEMSAHSEEIGSGELTDEHTISQTTKQRKTPLSERPQTGNGSQAASFLQRLTRIKQQKGEKDPVPLYGVKIYNAPSPEAQQAIRDAALQNDAEQVGRASDFPPARRRRYPRENQAFTTDARSATSTAVTGLKSSTTIRGRPSRDAIVQSLGFRDMGTADSENSLDVQVLSTDDEVDDDDGDDEYEGV